MKIVPGSQVDLWRQPEQKDIPGWRGPAVVMDVDTEANNVSVKWQGRMLGIPLRQVRPHVGYALAYMLFYQHLYFASPCSTLQYDAAVTDHVHTQVLYSDSHETQKVKPNGCFTGLAA